VCPPVAAIHILSKDLGQHSPLVLDWMSAGYLLCWKSWRAGTISALLVPSLQLCTIKNLSECLACKTVVEQPEALVPGFGTVGRTEGVSVSCPDLVPHLGDKH
jgi:hypothetical protein